MRTVHLLKDLGLYKSTIARKIRTYYAGWDDEVTNEARKLLAQRTQVYLLDDAALLAQFLLSGHDSCVMDHPEDFSPVELWIAERNDDNYSRISSILHRLRTEKAGE